MGNIINTEEDSKHVIKQFSFQTLEVNDDDIVNYPENPFEVPTVIDETTQIDEASQDQSIHPDHEELLQKIEQLTSDVVNLQMQQEKKEEEFIDKLTKTKDESYESGKADGMKELQEDISDEHEELKIQLIRSITLLDEEKEKFNTTLETLEHELLQSAFILAKKVIIKEVDLHSNQIATEIAKSLIQTLHESSEVTIKVNQQDHNHISSQFKDNHIKIVVDDAIAKGGIVILSNSGNIDGNILTRYQQSLLLLQKES